MNILQLIGEVGYKEVINIGERISVTYNDGYGIKEHKGILIEVDEFKMIVNGPIKEIKVQDILKIERSK